jgi:hypothetical protein
MGALDGFFDAQKSALNSQDRFVETRARNMAGRKLAGGDYTGAASELYGAGQLEAGAGVRKMQTQEQDRGLALEDRERGINQEETKRRGEFLMQLATGLEEVPDGERDATFERFIPALQSLGADEKLIGDLRSAPKDNASLRMFRGGVEEQLKGIVMAPGSQLRNPKTGALMAEAPHAPQLRTVGEGQSLVEISPGGGPKPSMTGGIQEIVQQLVPGARITSGRRTPERNAAVGGAPKSHHLTGNAMDITPPPGMDMKQLEAALRDSGMEFEELINEGDHVHIAWTGEGLPQGGARVVARGAPKADKQNAPSGYRYQPDGSLTFIPGGPADPSTAAGPKNLRPIPSTAQAGITANRNTLSKIDKAIAAIRANGGALGAANYFGDAIRQRTDPGGVSARALVADIGSAKLHDRSGAAVTAAESPRLMPFIPTVTDSPQAAIAKLENLRAEYFAAVDEAEAFYGPESGYRPMTLRPASASAAPAAQTAKPKAQPMKPVPQDIAVQAKAAISRGADRAAVIKRLRDNGYDPKGL